jgi:hypothetical protein
VPAGVSEGAVPPDQGDRENAMLLDQRSNIPTLLHITPDRLFTLSGALFVTRIKENVVLRRRYSRPVDRLQGFVLIRP